MHLTHTQNLKTLCYSTYQSCWTCISYRQWIYSSSWCTTLSDYCSASIQLYHTLNIMLKSPPSQQQVKVNREPLLNMYDTPKLSLASWMWKVWSLKPLLPLLSGLAIGSQNWSFASWIGGTSQRSMRSTASWVAGQLCQDSVITEKNILCLPWNRESCLDERIRFVSGKAAYPKVHGRYLWYPMIRFAVSLAPQFCSYDIFHP